MRVVLVCLLLLGVAADIGFGARILGVLLMPSRSHGILMERLIRELGDRGHHVTYITGAPPVSNPGPNLNIVHVPGVYEKILSSGPAQGSVFNLRGKSPWWMFAFPAFAGPTLTDFILSDEKVQELIKSKDEKFDLILGETFLDENILAGFSHKFQAPIVGVMAFLPNIWGNYLTGSPTPTSYIPETQLGYTTRMSFFQRLHNFLYSLAWNIYHPLIYLEFMETVMHKHFSSDMPPIQDILKNTSLVLVNHHHSLAFPRPYVPNMVEVAGMHINPVKPLPADLQKYMDDSKQGVIFFSLGSNVKSSEMPPEKREAILRGFARLPFNILWKFEEQLDNLPKNVKIEKWLPQSDLLAHPKLKLFITHGGMLSTTEAVWRGIPVLGIPIFGDQPLNMKHTENAGLGKTLIYEEITEDSIYDDVMELVTNPKYLAAARRTSALLQDTPKPPLETAVWWIEYILRNNGAPFLRSAAQDLNWIQLNQIDVIATLAAAVILVFVVLIKLCRALSCRQKKDSTTTGKKKTRKVD